MRQARSPCNFPYHEVYMKIAMILLSFLLLQRKPGCWAKAA